MWSQANRNKTDNEILVHISKSREISSFCNEINERLQFYDSDSGAYIKWSVKIAKNLNFANIPGQNSVWQT